MGSKRVSMIAAACQGNGIGFKGSLPWRLKNEMAYFTRITSETKDVGKKNAVIMGRKSWDSIPPKYRPLPGRVNVVISRTLGLSGQSSGSVSGQSGDSVSGEGSDVQEVRGGNGPDSTLPDHVFDSLTKCISFLSEEEGIERIFIIGGQQLYELGLKEPTVTRIYLTRIHSDFQCDTFFPNLDSNHWSEVSIPGVPKEEQVEKEIKYNFHVYERNN